MADKAPVNTVVDENDIPRSVLDMNKLSSYRVDELKFWLSCRGDSLKNLSTKAACIQRINNYVKNGLLKKCNDPTPIQTYTRGKALRERNSGDIKSDPFLSNCVTSEK
ncbi:PREDICTED: uncharacterized protein LOC107339700 [Acropora digitifera]|uniref:uncharacterized protein LOC107339700 n=1 Tax=Acropora digitifera TaxID=70779 RepID=UPI00077ACB84|nr:PREDICTED: uncharacterized protein LOC107339700 [Acropora digitifera]